MNEDAQLWYRGLLNKTKKIGMRQATLAFMIPYTHLYGFYSFCFIYALVVALLSIVLLLSLKNIMITLFFIFPFSFSPNYWFNFLASPLYLVKSEATNLPSYFLFYALKLKMN